MSMFKTLKGFIGELKVRFYLFLVLGFGYAKLHNITIGFPNGGSSQIDHLVIGKGGIFVIETKNYSGLIEATINEKNWKQSFGNKHYQFYNPVMQNESHLSSLRYLLKSKKYPMHNIVVFVGKAKFKGKPPKNVFPDLLSCVCYIASRPKTKLTRQQVSQIKNTINQRRLPNNLATKRRHIRYAKSRQDKYKR